GSHRAQPAAENRWPGECFRESALAFREYLCGFAATSTVTQRRSALRSGSWLRTGSRRPVTRHPSGGGKTLPAQIPSRLAWKLDLLESQAVLRHTTVLAIMNQRDVES